MTNQNKDDDGDGIPDLLDNDDDNDGVPDHLDNDDDNDGIPDIPDNPADPERNLADVPREYLQRVADVITRLRNEREQFQDRIHELRQMALPSITDRQELHDRQVYG